MKKPEILKSLELKQATHAMLRYCGRTTCRLCPYSVTAHDGALLCNFSAADLHTNMVALRRVSKYAGTMYRRKRRLSKKYAADVPLSVNLTAVESMDLRNIAEMYEVSVEIVVRVMINQLRRAVAGAQKGWRADKWPERDLTYAARASREELSRACIGRRIPRTD